MPTLRVVFDLDGVIATRDTMAELIRRQLLSHPARVVVGLVPVAAWSLLRGFPATRIRMSRALGVIALSGLSHDAYGRLASRVGRELAGNPSWVIADGVTALRTHLDAGDDVTVTTGTELLLSRAFLDAVGFAGVDLVGTRIVFGRVRARYANHNLGPRKVQNLDGRTIDLFYTDSELDLEVARLASRTVLVNPDARLERLFAATIEDLTVVRWS